MKFALPLRLCISASILSVGVLAGCGEKKDSPGPTTPPAAASTAPATIPTESTNSHEDRKASLFESVSGVWKPDVGTGLITIYAADHEITMIQGDTVFQVNRSDVDVDNETVTFKVNIRGKDEIRTIARFYPEDGSSNRLKITAADGTQQELTFIRKLSRDDFERIDNLHTTPGNDESRADSDLSTTRGVIDLYLGAVDTNLRSCPGKTCSAIIVIPKDTKVRADTSSIRFVTESSGAQTPWARVTYEGTVCLPAEMDQNTSCTPSQTTSAPITGWMNYTRLFVAQHAEE